MSSPQIVSALPASPTPLADSAQWLSAAWDWLRTQQLTGWTIPADSGGQGLPAVDVMAGMLELARRQLPVAFVLSQFQAAASRIAASSNVALRARLLPQLATGELMATVGISHLTTSRQSDGQPAIRIHGTAAEQCLTGTAPWVTAATIADVVVTGALDVEGAPRLFAVPTDRAGMTIEAPRPLLALTETGTTRVSFVDVVVTAEEEIVMPAEQDPKSSKMGPGSLGTSALALGHAFAAIDCLQDEVAHSPHLRGGYELLATEAEELRTRLFGACQALGDSNHSPETLRTATTSLAIRAAQTLITASRGAGFVSGHPAERLMRESLFFLVWSCPQGVATRLVDELSRCDRL